MKNDYTFEDALNLVNTQAPAASEKNRIFWAEEIIRIKEETGESAERIWLLYL